ncbi:DUF441 domain-containing protein [Thermovorax subterraneus]|nr:DUF441 domain-containing protein [Thermovorax subterraneus]
MDQGTLAILIILCLGILSKNNTLALAATIVLGLKLTNLKQIILYLDEHAIRIGVTILTIGILTPFVSGRITLKDMENLFKSPVAVLAMLAGTLTVALSGRGLGFINENPAVVSGIVLGSVIGVAFFKGVPIGPMTAAGIVAVILSLMKR